MAKTGREARLLPGGRVVAGRARQVVVDWPHHRLPHAEVEQAAHRQQYDRQHRGVPEDQPQPYPPNMAADGSADTWRQARARGNRWRSVVMAEAAQCVGWCCEMLLGFNLVPDPTHRLEHGMCESAIDLIAEIVNIYVYHV